MRETDSPRTQQLELQGVNRTQLVAVPWSFLEMPCQLTPALDPWEREGKALSLLMSLISLEERLSLGCCQLQSVPDQKNRGGGEAADRPENWAGFCVHLPASGLPVPAQVYLRFMCESPASPIEVLDLFLSGSASHSSSVTN